MVSTTFARFVEELSSLLPLSFTGSDFFLFLFWFVKAGGERLESISFFPIERREDDFFKESRLSEDFSPISFFAGDLEFFFAGSEGGGCT